MTEEPADWQRRIGGKLEKFSHDVFDAFRWMTIVALTRYMAIKTDSGLALAVSYGLAAMLMVFLFSIFMLRGNFAVFQGSSRYVQPANIAVNFLLCFSIFLFSLWLTYEIVDVFVVYQQG